MRRPRSKLEVSTFPFLAVLLCVMGSLLLLLFIMDRRAKIAAQYRVNEELVARKERTKAEEEARQAEWEKAKQALHQTLLAQQEELTAESKGLEQNLNSASKDLTLTQARQNSLEQNIKAEADKIGAIQIEIENRRTDLRDAAKKETMTKAELLDAARELAELEQAFRRLKSLKAAEHQTYSVVPYRGKRGDSRLPIYIECVRDGVIFHPEDRTLTGLRFTVGSVRDEVERRSGPLAFQRALDPDRPLSDDQKGPYVLFLVRPEGIGNYYRAQTALRGYQLDFGYELVEDGWVLDFNKDSRAKPGLASKPGVPDLRVEPVVPPLLAGNGGPFRPGEPIGPSANNNGGGGSPGRGGAGSQPLVLTPPIGFGPSSPSTQPGGGTGNQQPVLLPPSLPTQTGGNSGAQAGGPSFVPIGQSPPMFPSIDNTERGGNPNAQGGGSPNPANPGVATPGQQQPGTGTPGNSGNGQASAKGTIGKGDGKQSGGGATGDPSGDAPGPRPLGNFGNDSAKKPTPAPPLSRLLGNKDFIINVDCHGNYATITPGGLTFRWNPANLKETDDALVAAVKNLIARRQASVQPGEPPYRPLIRLCVHADGLNTLYRAYPLLDRIGATMTRENVSE